jgi:hypothetical protein
MPTPPEWSDPASGLTHHDLLRDIKVLNQSRATVSITWNDVPHLDETAKEEMRRATPPHLISAREHGIPAIGSGVVYPINVKDVLIKPFEIPVFWPRLYALDVGIRRTAALWLAWDREESIVYLYSEHYSANELPSVHAAAIKARGAWIPGVVDPSSRNRSPTDGQRLFTQYTELGLNLVPAKNAVESGIYRIQEMFAEGRIRVFNTLQNWREEITWYRRNEDGKIVKEYDHLMDCTRYLIHEFQTHAITKPSPTDKRQRYRPGISSIGY